MTDLLESIAELTHLRNRHELEQAFAELAYQLAGASCVTLWRAGRGEGEARLRRQVVLPRPALTIGDLPPLRADCRRCLETCKPVCGQDDGGMASRHVFPIHDGGRVSGLLEITRPEPLGRDDMHRLDLLTRVYGNHAGLLDYGERDELTGLLNRRSFSTVFTQKLPVARGVIAVADIDFFKRINDEFGHPYGDEVLILMARLMEACFSEAEGVFRFGGEEFLVLLAKATSEDAWLKLESFRAAVYGAVFPQVGRVTVSIGFTTLRPDDTPAAAFGRADEALYVAKQCGRNQVQCHEWLVLDGSVSGQKKANSQIELF